MPRRSRKPSRRETRSKRAKGRSILRRLKAFLMGLAVVAAGIGVYGVYVTVKVAAQFEARRWDVPAQVYAAPLELYAGRALTQRDLVAELDRLGYSEDARLAAAGTYRTGSNRVEIATRGFAYAGDVEPARVVAVELTSGEIDSLRAVRGDDDAIVRLDPLLIGSLFPALGEERLNVAAEDGQPLLVDVLKSGEEQRLGTHQDLDTRGTAS